MQRIGHLWRKHKDSVWLFLLLLLCYGYFFPRWGDWNQNSRLDLTMAIVEDGVLYIDAYGRNTGDYALYAGHMYSDKAPGASFLGVPIYAAFRQVVKALGLETRMAEMASSSAIGDTMTGEDTASVMQKTYQAAVLYVLMIFASALPSAMLGVLLYDLLKTIVAAPSHRLGVVLLYALGTGAFPYANAFLGHQLVAAMLFTAFYLLFKMKQDKPARAQLALVGFLLGYALITEYPALLITIPLLGYAAYRLSGQPTLLLWIILGAIPPLGLLAWYNYAIYGTVIPLGYRYSALWQAEHSTGFLSLTYPHPKVIWELLFGTYRGLFTLSPALLLAVPGYICLWRMKIHRAEGLVSLMAVLAFLAFNSSSSMWGGGFAVGPRYLLPALPLLVWPIGYWLRHSSRRGATLYVLLGLLSVALVWAQTIGGRTFPRYERIPLIQVSLPNLMVGNIARNLGMLAGLSGWLSLVPLLLAAAGMGSGLCRVMVQTASQQEDTMCPGSERASSTLPGHSTICEGVSQCKG